MSTEIENPRIVLEIDGVRYKAVKANNFGCYDCDLKGRCTRDFGCFCNSVYRMNVCFRKE